MVDGDLADQDGATPEVAIVEDLERVWPSRIHSPEARRRKTERPRSRGALKLRLRSERLAFSSQSVSFPQPPPDLPMPHPGSFGLRGIWPPHPTVPGLLPVPFVGAVILAFGFLQTLPHDGPPLPSAVRSGATSVRYRFSLETHGHAWHNKKSPVRIEIRTGLLMTCSCARTDRLTPSRLHAPACGQPSSAARRSRSLRSCSRSWTSVSNSSSSNQVIPKRIWPISPALRRL